MNFLLLFLISSSVTVREKRLPNAWNMFAFKAAWGLPITYRWQWLSTFWSPAFNRAGEIVVKFFSQEHKIAKHI